MRTVSLDFADRDVRRCATRQTRRVVGLVGALVLGVATSAAATPPARGHYGLSTGPVFEVTGDHLHHNASETFTLINPTSHAVFVRRIGRSGEGLRLMMTPTWATAQRVRPHGSLRVTISFHVPHCNLVTNAPWPLSLQATWTTTTWERVDVNMTSDGRTQWQKYLADAAC